MLTLGVWPATASAQAISYVAQSTAFSWISTSLQGPVTWSGGAACAPRTYDGATPDDDITAPLPLGFKFAYGGTNYTAVQIDANGRLQFGNSVCGYGGPFIQIPTTRGNTINTPVNSIIPYSLDFDPGDPSIYRGRPEQTVCALPGCGVFYGTGTSSQGVPYFVVTWLNVPQSGYQRPGFSVQVILYANGTFEFQYQNNRSDPPRDFMGNLPAIGWVLNRTGNYYNYPYVSNLPALNGKAILFVPNLLNSIQVSSGAYASICAPQAVSIVARDAAGNVLTSYAGLMTLSTSTGNGSWSVNTANGTLTNSGGGSATYQFSPSDAGSIVLNLTDANPETLTVSASDFGTGISGASSAITFSARSFVITTDAIQVAGRPQQMSASYYRNCRLDRGYNHTQGLETWLTLDPAQPAGAIVPGITAASSVSALPTAKPRRANVQFTFRRGVASFTLDTRDVGKYVLNLSDPRSGAQGSSATITTRPFGLALTNIRQGTVLNPEASTATGAVFAKAGTDFSATVGAYLWQAADDINNDGVPDPGANITNNGLVPSFAWPTTISAISPYQPSSGTLGAVNNGTIVQGAFRNGQATDTTLQYTQVGSMTLRALATNYLGTAGVDVTGTSAMDGSSGYVGRFIPDHFSLENTTPAPSLSNRADLTCSPASSFSYMNESMQAQFRLTARNALGAVTTNYTGAWARLALSTPSGLNFGAVSGSTNLTPRLIFGSTSGNWSNGSATVTQLLAVQRASPDTPDGPYPNTAVGIAPRDPDGVQLVPSAYDLNVDGTGGNDHEKIGSATEILFGRLVMENALSNGRVPTPVPIETQYWNGSAFATNTLDNCTRIARSSFVLDGYEGSVNPAGGNCKTFIQENPIVFSAGVGTLHFAPPTGAATGSLRLSANLYGTPSGKYCPSASNPPATATAANMTYLLGRWNDSLNPDGNPNTYYDDDPVARAAFGLYGSAPKSFIFLRENY